VDKNVAEKKEVYKLCGESSAKWLQYCVW